MMLHDSKRVLNATTKNFCDYLGSLVVQNSSVSYKEEDISHEQKVKILMFASEKGPT